MNIKGIKKNIKKSMLRFPEEMYSDTTGSLAIIGYMFSDDKPSVSSLVKLWKKNDIYFSDPEYLNKVWDYFNMKPEFGKNGLGLTMYQSEWNVLFHPTYNDVVLPIREDGLFSQTVRKGKAYKIEFNKTDN